MTSARRVVATATSAGPPTPLSAPLIREVPFSFSGPLTVATSPPWFPRFNLTIVEFFVGLGAVSTSGSVSVNLLVNLGVVATATIDALATTGDVSGLSLPVVKDTDRVQVRIASVGTGAADLFASVRF